MTSIQKRMCDALIEAGLKAYMPGVHEGKCTEPYAVVTDAGRIRTGKTTGKRSYVVTVYVPATRPTMLAPLLLTVNEAMLGVREVRVSGDISPDAILEEIEAYCASVEYTALCAT